MGGLQFKIYPHLLLPVYNTFADNRTTLQFLPVVHTKAEIAKGEPIYAAQSKFQIGVVQRRRHRHLIDNEYWFFYTVPCILGADVFISFNDSLICRNEISFWYSTPHIRNLKRKDICRVLETIIEYLPSKTKYSIICRNKFQGPIYFYHFERATTPDYSNDIATNIFVTEMRDNFHKIGNRTTCLR